VNLEDSWGAGKLDSIFGEDRYEALAERFKLLPGVPDLTYQDVSIRAKKADVVVETGGGNSSPAFSNASQLLSYFSAVTEDLGLKRTTMLIGRMPPLAIGPEVYGTSIEVSSG